MSRHAGPLFVERRKYRRRRLMDAARILPVAGFVLLMLPMLWARGDGSGIAGEAVYLFAVWALLVLAAALLARPLGKGPITEVAPPPPALPAKDALPRADTASETPADGLPDTATDAAAREPAADTSVNSGDGEARP